MAVTSFKRSRIRAGLNKYDSMLVGNTQFIDAVDVSGGLLSADSTYYYRTFKSSGSLVVSGGAIVADILVVGAGGGADWTGAGAGGLLGFTGQSLAVGTYTVTVGAGGAYQNNGNNSQFASLTAAVGGGKGGGATGGDGGSGGGSMGDTTSPYGLTGGHGSRVGYGTSGQGNNGGGGAWYYNNAYGGGGGGGAGAVGATTTTGTGGNGGVGVSTYSSWGLATGTGQNVSGTVYYAGGGGGGGGNNQGVNAPGGSGGYGGGGQGGSALTTASDGVANTGGGAGGTAWGSVGSTAGGSGIVIVRYLKTAVQATQTDFELIGTVELTSAQSSVTFTGLPSEYKHLQIRATSRGTDPSPQRNLIMQFNSDTGTNYARHGLPGYNDGTGFAIRPESAASTTYIVAATSPAANNTANVFGGAIVDILDAFSTSKYKTARTLSGYMDSTSSFAAGIALSSGMWMNTNAISSITFSMITQNIAANSRFSIYGLRG